MFQKTLKLNFPRYSVNYYLLTVYLLTDITLTAQMCILVFAHCVTSDFEVLELVDFQSVQGQANGLDFSQALLCNLQKHNLELSKLMGMVSDSAPSLIGYKMV
jgi:hypothetical protein